MAEQNQSSCESLTLPQSLNGAQVTGLCEALVALRGSPITLRAGDVEHVGAQSLQLLIAARNTWSNDGHPFQIATPSDAMVRDLALLGHPIEWFESAGEHA